MTDTLEKKIERKSVGKLVESKTAGDRIVRWLKAADPIYPSLKDMVLVGPGASPSLTKIEVFRKSLLALTLRGVFPRLKVGPRRSPKSRRSVKTGVPSVPVLNYRTEPNCSAKFRPPGKDSSGEWAKFAKETGFCEYFGDTPVTVQLLLNSEAFAKAVYPWVSGPMGEVMQIDLEACLYFSVAQKRCRSLSELALAKARFKRFPSDILYVAALNLMDIRREVRRRKEDGSFPLVASATVSSLVSACPEDFQQYAYLKRDYPCPEIDEGPYG